MSASQTVFLLLAVVAGISALAVVILPNPTRAALALVANFFTLACLYFSMGAQLLGITQILVYAGAIMVLFLFVIMLLNLSGPHERGTRPSVDLKPYIGVALGFVLFGLVTAQLLLPLQAVGTTVADPLYGAPQSIGKSIMTRYVWPFEIASVLLLIGVVGSILLAKRRL